MSSKKSDGAVIEDSESAAMDKVLPSISKPTGTTIKLPVVVNPQFYPRANVFNYELRMKEVFERHPIAPHSDRAAVCLQVFEEIIPKLNPVFEPSMRLIINEMDRSIFAEHYTSNSTDQNVASQGKIINRVPYFVLSKRNNEKRDTDMKQLKETVADLEHKLKFREKDIHVLVKKNLGLRTQMDVLEEEVKQLRAANDELRIETQRHQFKRDELKSMYDQTLEQIKSENQSLQSRLEFSQKTVQKLSSVKGGYGNLEQKSTDTSLLQSGQQRKTLRGTAMNFLQIDIESVRKLKQQLTNVIVEQMDDYDNTLWEISQKHSIMQNSSVRQSANFAQALIADQSNMVKTFKKRVQQCLDEFNLLLETEKHAVISYGKWREREKQKYVQRMTDIFRRDAIQLSYSTDGGKSFDLYRDSPYCKQCNVPSMVLCPHQVEFVYEIKLWDGKRATKAFFLDHAWTNVRFERPQLTFNIPEEANALEDANMDSTRKMIAETLQQLAPLEKKPDDELTLEYLDTKLSRRMRSLWRDFYVKRDGKKPPFPRTMTLERLLWHIEEFYKIRFLVEEVYLENFDCAGKLEDMNSDLGRKRDALGFYRDLQFTENLLDGVYEFLKIRYQFHDLAMQVMYEILCALRTYENSHRTVKHFIRHLYGDHDVQWKYYALMKEIGVQFEPMDLANYRKMVRLLFPYRVQAEFYEHIELEDISFTKSRLSTDAFFERMMRLILQHREPNLVAFHSRMMKDLDLPAGSTTLTRSQFEGFMNRNFTPAPSELVRRRWNMATRNLPKKDMDIIKDGSLPIYRAASIAAYCLLWCIKRWGNSAAVPALTVDGDEILKSILSPDSTGKKVISFGGDEEFLDHLEKDDLLIKGSLPDEAVDIKDEQMVDNQETPAIQEGVADAHDIKTNDESSGGAKIVGEGEQGQSQANEKEDESSSSEDDDEEEEDGNGNDEPESIQPQSEK